MISLSSRLFAFLGLVVLVPVSLPALADSLLRQLTAEAPDVSPRVLALALEARECAAISGVAPSSARLAVIDYSRPSTEPRLWVFDLSSEPQLLYAEHVAHGSGSGGNRAVDFSNTEGSHQSSLGLFLTAETYHGGNGYSLRLDGLESGINDRARERYIVMHGAWYVDPDLALRQGRLGRSQGCPAVREEVAGEVIDTLAEGQLLFAYYPDSDWLSSSPFIGCRANNVARVGPERVKPGLSP
ncbi:murein L,D-transpeptidase catalytic domain family protein [Elongatibacter sediminis]|uniref:Murein L,D-transpeptidase catalytic domain family protein n=1 Tax=Elongatibacter sediminis TaxID=3119006 RepID=A0AAW9RPU4_9GAMM